MGEQTSVAGTCRTCGSAPLSQDDRDSFAAERESLESYESDEWFEDFGLGPASPECPRCRARRLCVERDELAEAALRLKTELEIRARESFMDRMLAGGPEGFWVLATILLALMLLAIGLGR